MTSGISGISLPREFCLDSRIYNILDKIRNRYMREKDRDGNGIP